MSKCIFSETKYSTVNVAVKIKFWFILLKYNSYITQSSIGNVSISLKSINSATNLLMSKSIHGIKVYKFFLKYFSTWWTLYNTFVLGLHVHQEQWSLHTNYGRIWKTPVIKWNINKNLTLNYCLLGCLKTFILTASSMYKSTWSISNTRMYGTKGTCIILKYFSVNFQERLRKTTNTSQYLNLYPNPETLGYKGEALATNLVTIHCKKSGICSRTFCS